MGFVQLEDVWGGFECVVRVVEDDAGAVANERLFWCAVPSMEGRTLKFCGFCDG
jgi:hypothetical protein